LGPDNRPRRRPNGDLRTREHLTEAEVERLIEAAKGNRWGHRRHHGPRRLPARPTGFRAGRPGIRWTSERCTSAGSRRARLARIRSSGTNCGRCGAKSRSRSRRSCSPRSGERRSPRRGLPAWSSAQAPKPSWPSRLTHTMLRHACGYAPANRGHDTRALQAYLGHRNIQHTVRYSELSPTRFKDFWRK
jgi:hypothetical protein